MTPPARVVVAGLGSEFRGDDGVGPVVARLAVARSLHALDVGPIEDPLDLLTTWDGADLAVVVDAVRAGGPAGEVVTVEVAATTGTPPPPDTTRAAASSTHGLSLVSVLRLSRALGRGPARVVVVAVRGEDFSRHEGLSAPVAGAVPEAVRRVVELIEEVRSCA